MRLAGNKVDTTYRLPAKPRTNQELGWHSYHVHGNLLEEILPASMQNSEYKKTTLFVRAFL